MALAYIFSFMLLFFIPILLNHYAFYYDISMMAYQEKLHLLCSILDQYQKYFYFFLDLNS